MNLIMCCCGVLLSQIIPGLSAADEKCKAHKGICQSATLSCLHNGKTGKYVSGLCTGKSTRCCLSTGTGDQKCTEYGGKCQSTNVQCHGSFYPKLCLGQRNDVMCCLAGVFTGEKLSDSDARRMLTYHKIAVSSTGSCINRQQGNCTSLDQVRKDSIQEIIRFKQESQCKIVVSGGTEIGHAGGDFSHWNGWKLDISLYPPGGSCTTQKVERDYTPLTWVRKDGALLFRDDKGNIWAKETAKNHWDILYFHSSTSNSTPKPTQPSSNAGDSKCTVHGGTCQNEQLLCKHNGKTGKYLSKLCAGDKARRCCLSTGTEDQMCREYGGKCQSTTAQCHGSFYPKLCLGQPNDVMCCLTGVFTGKKLSDSEARKMLKNQGIQVSSTGSCNDRQQKTCTSLEQVRKDSIQEIIRFKQESKCEIVVSGGTEIGHAGGDFSHWNGWKLDISLHPPGGSCATQKVEKDYTPLTWVRKDGALLFRDDKGNIWAKETAKNHWDILYFHSSTTNSDQTQKIPQNECRKKGEKGDCDFYKCASEIFGCSASDYLLAYGYRYCNRFKEHYKSFTPQGQKWIDGVRKCLMISIINVFDLKMSCDKLKTFAFASHPDCYLLSEPGICNVAQSATNLGKLLWDVFEIRDFTGADSDLATEQVIQVMKSCSSSLVSKVRDEILQIFGQTKKEPEKEINGATEKYAAAGDCKFYKIFEERFPCSNWFKNGYIADFEFHLCERFSKSKILFADRGKWIMDTGKCIMNALLPTYKGNSVACNTLMHEVFEIRENCYKTFDICGFEDETRNQMGMYTITAATPEDSLYFEMVLSVFRYEMKYLRIDCRKRNKRSTSRTRSRHCHKDSTDKYQLITSVEGFKMKIRC